MTERMRETVMFAAHNTTHAGHGVRHGALYGIAHLLHVWLERVHTRRHLSELDDHMLSDIGLTRFDVEMEARRPFWRGFGFR